MEQSIDEQHKINFLLSIVHKQEQTTMEIEMKYRAFSPSCPEEVVKLLNKLKKNGTISGVVSHDKGGYVWWKE
ncbi:MAG: hypothetical protein ABR986_05670 [Methanomassiliicoccales archaeon]